MSLDDTHDPGRVSWVESARPGSDFPVQNLPLGIFSEAKGLRSDSSCDYDVVTHLLADQSWSNEGLFAFIHGLRALRGTRDTANHV